jgi:phospho-N-acetylmuramoyl-pentapeptide-transferase
MIFYPILISLFRSKNIRENVNKNDSPRLDNILRMKNSTPTMGGILIIFSIIISAFIICNFKNPVIPVLIIALLIFCLIGLVDDYLKIKRNPKGMSIFTKLILQILAGYLIGILVYLALLRQDPENASKIFLPFDGVIELGVFYPTFVMFFVLICCNAVNVTDGLDGLATGTLLIALFSFSIVCYIVGRKDFSHYLNIPYMRSSAELTILCAASFGACLGFLWYNIYPAQIFMGDSGSVPLGAFLGIVACISKQEFLLLFVAAIFLIEFSSSFLQVVWFKIFKRRIFSIAPIHHIYQFKGMHEVKITTRLLILQAILAILALATFKLR